MSVKNISNVNAVVTSTEQIHIAGQHPNTLSLANATKFSRDLEALFNSDCLGNWSQFDNSTKQYPMGYSNEKQIEKLISVQEYGSNIENIYSQAQEGIVSHIAEQIRFYLSTLNLERSLAS